MDMGIIPCLSDAKLEGAAIQLAGPGYHGICGWHTTGRGALRAGTNSLLVFDEESGDKWQVRSQISS